MTHAQIPEIWFFVVESLILIFVFAEFIIGWLSYKALTRKKGRPKKSRTEILMIKLSKQLQKSLAKGK